jgi:hypothetical protein
VENKYIEKSEKSASSWLKIHNLRYIHDVFYSCNRHVWEEKSADNMEVEEKVALLLTSVSFF